VSGNHFVNGAGQSIRLLGVNRSGAEFACVGGYGLLGGDVFDNPATVDAAIAAIASWHTNVVRVTLNEDCWLGINAVPVGLGGAPYQSAIVDFVNRLHQHNLYVILTLQWNAPGSLLATGQQPMVDADHGPAFWRSLATTFKNDPAVIFDLYSEPYGVDWNCWLNGCTSPGWQTAGMQTLVNTVRNTGATQPIMVAGLDWANDLSQWLAHRPADPNNAIVASAHVYPGNACNSNACWDGQYGPIAAQVPIVTGEIGAWSGPCDHVFVDAYMAWADAHGVSYTFWAWDTWGCTAGNGAEALITDYSGTPTAYGIGVKNHLAAINP
jgi:hypothetical protein